MSDKKEKRLFAHIQSGKFKGKKLLLPSLETTRSTKSIVQACVFNVLRGELAGKTFIEGFGGSALMALEALSNHALKAFAIEKDEKAFKIASSNAKDIEGISILKGDSFELLPQLLRNEREIILYLDPPFDTRAGFEDVYQRLLKLAHLENVSKLIFEQRSSFKMPENIGSLSLFKFKKFGLTALSFYTKKE